MNRHIRPALLLLIAVLAPGSASAAAIDISNVALTAFGSFSTQLQPVKTDLDRQSAPFGSLLSAEVLVTAEGVNGMPFPNVPTSQTRPFASSSANGKGEFGVGVNGFFFQNSLPPNTLLASGTTTFSFTNTSNLPLLTPLVQFFIPAPTIRFFGVGDSTFPDGADRARDATADAVIDVVLTLTRADGSKHEEILIDYGLQVLRAPQGTALLPIPRRDGVGKITRFDEPDGSFGFLLPDLVKLGRVELGPGDTVEFSSHYSAKVSTGFGETGVFAAIGDPFNLSVGGGRFELQLGDALPPGPGPAAGVPEPGTWATLGLGLLVLLGISARRGRKEFTTRAYRRNTAEASRTTASSHVLPG